MNPTLAASQAALAASAAPPASALPGLEAWPLWLLGAVLALALWWTALRRRGVRFGRALPWALLAAAAVGLGAWMVLPAPNARLALALGGLALVYAWPLLAMRGTLSPAGEVSMTFRR